MAGAKKILTDYKLVKTIGTGAFSKVKLAIHKKTGEKVAIKIVSKKRLEAKKKGSAARAAANRKPGDPEPAPRPKPHDYVEEGSEATNDFFMNISREVRLLQLLEQPNVIKLYQVIQTEGEIYIIMQYAEGGEMIDHIASKKTLGEDEARIFFRQIVSAMDHCHKSGVIHRDLKLENILLDDSKHILITDFGLGRTFKWENLCGTFCGTPLYAAPELVSGVKYVGPPADIWAMGVVLYAMIYGKPPFQAESMTKLYKKIRNVEYKCPSWFSKELKSLLSIIFVKDSTKRASVDDIINHPWVLGPENEPVTRYPPTVAEHQIGEYSIDNCIAIRSEKNFMSYAFHEIRSAKGESGCEPTEENRRRNSLVPSDKGEDKKRRKSSSSSRKSSVFSEMGWFNDRSSLSSQDNSVEDGGCEVPSTPPRVRIRINRSSQSEDEFDLQKNVLPSGEPSLIVRDNGIRHRASVCTYGSKPIVESDVNPIVEPLPIRRSTLSEAMIVRRSSMKTDKSCIPEEDSSSTESRTKPRSVRRLFTLATTSGKKSAETLLDEVTVVLNRMSLKYRHTEPFLIHVLYENQVSLERVEFSVEIVKVWLLSMYGIQLHRISGDSWLYKELYSKISKAIYN
eukprot:Nk52_evm22s805 gene=Nk52_evmTU22s805